MEHNHFAGILRRVARFLCFVPSEHPVPTVSPSSLPVTPLVDSPPINSVHSTPEVKQDDENSSELLYVSKITPDEITAVHSDDSSLLQFFVRLISASRKLNNCKTMVVLADRSDTVLSIHKKIYTITGIPVIKQTLVYKGKSLPMECNLAECSIQKDEELQLFARMNTELPQAWQDVISITENLDLFLSDEESLDYCPIIKKLRDFFEVVAENNKEEFAANHFKILGSSDVPNALVTLYMSPDSRNKSMAEDLMTNYFFSLSKSIVLPESIHITFAPVVLKLCKLLRESEAALDDPMYVLGRTFLGSLVKNEGFKFESFPTFFKLKDIFSLFNEIANSMYTQDLYPYETGRTLEHELTDLKAFFTPLQTAFMEQVKLHGPMSLPVRYNSIRYGVEIESLHVIYIDLLKKMDDFLCQIEGPGDEEDYSDDHSCLDILKGLNDISKIYVGSEEQFWNVMKLRRVSVCNIIIKHANPTEDHQWLLERKDVTNFECRRHLAMKMLPEYSYWGRALGQQPIDRSRLFVESFEYISRADPVHLVNHLSMSFKNESAIGVGVLREWFFLVCQAIFNPQNVLFVACENDHRRFYPNSASTVNPLHLKYFHFAGRVIALALMCKVQIGIVFDRVFFLQLAGMHVSLEDIKVADPYLYNSYKQIMEMDADFVDSGALGLTFVREFEEFGSRSVVELCPDGTNLAVHSRNRGLYINLLIHHQFVKSISKQVSHFAKGFADILLDSCKPHSLFFERLELEDLDCLLYGNENDICVKDWRVHTNYAGYKAEGCQIQWFWENVEEMSPEQRKALLFFWTSVKYLPVEGFRGLSSTLQISIKEVHHDHLPSSHTCFFQLNFPEYPSKAFMKKQLNIITQEHVGTSFENNGFCDECAGQDGFQDCSACCAHSVLHGRLDFTLLVQIHMLNKYFATRLFFHLLDHDIK